MNYSKKLLVFTHLVLLFGGLQAQQLEDPDHFLIPDKGALPKIFLVGTFHFEYYNLDAYKTDKSKQVDILSAQKQAELKELLSYIEAFRPTKICIEAGPGWKAIDRYRNYINGKKGLGKNEVEQIAFRLMEKFSLDTVYSIDAESIADDLVKNKDSAIIKPYIDSIFSGYTFKSNEIYVKWRDYVTAAEKETSLLFYFKYRNSSKSLQRDYGAYLTGDFRLRNFDGADALATYWYNRNLRIFRNIQKINTSPADRILVLFGAGHVAILDQLFKCSPEFDYIPFNELK